MPGWGNGPDAFFKLKPDIKAFKTLTDQSKWRIWSADFENVIASQGALVLMDRSYDPKSSAEKQAWRNMQSFYYLVMSRIIQTTEGRHIVNKYRVTKDARSVIAELYGYAKVSTHAAITSGNLLRRISNMTLDKAWKKTAVQFLIYFTELVEYYNRMQPSPAMRLTEAMCMHYLENAVRPVKELNDVKKQAMQLALSGGEPVSYELYNQLLRSAATVYDEDILIQRQARTDSRRSTNVHEHRELPDNDTPRDDEPGVEREIEVFMSRLRPRMNKETWQSLQSNEQELWDQLSDEAKSKILSYAKNRQERSTRSANTHEIGSDGDSSPSTPTEAPSPDEGTSSKSIDVNVSEAVKSAHPGDARRMLSKPASSKKREVSMLQWRDPISDNEYQRAPMGLPTSPAKYAAKCDAYMAENSHPPDPNYPPLSTDDLLGGDYLPTKSDPSQDLVTSLDDLPFSLEQFSNEANRANMMDAYWNEYNGSDSDDEDFY